MGVVDDRVAAKALKSNAYDHIGWDELVPVLGAGLRLLGDHVATLVDTLSRMGTPELAQGRKVVELVADEEAAKVLIVLDLARAGRNDTAVSSRLRQAFYDHHARLLYGYVYEMSPADYREVVQHVERVRVSHYLDGPNDTDWVFRNALVEGREETLYVDLVHRGVGEPDQWVTPLNRSVPCWGGLSTVVRVVMALRRMGVVSEQGLRVCRDVRAGVRLCGQRDQAAGVEQTPWQGSADLNRQVVEQVFDPVGGQVEDEDVRLVRDHWGFPLGELDLREKPVPVSELRDVQASAVDGVEHPLVWNGL